MNLSQLFKPSEPPDHDGRCKKCSGHMVYGKAIAQTFTGIPDFAGDAHAVTVSPGGSGKLVDCMKCELCGWSVSI